MYSFKDIPVEILWKIISYIDSIFGIDSIENCYPSGLGHSKNMYDFSCFEILMISKKYYSTFYNINRLDLNAICMMKISEYVTFRFIKKYYDVIFGIGTSEWCCEDFDEKLKRRLQKLEKLKIQKEYLNNEKQNLINLKKCMKKLELPKLIANVSNTLKCSNQEAIKIIVKNSKTKVIPENFTPCLLICNLHKYYTIQYNIVDYLLKKIKEQTTSHLPLDKRFLTGTYCSNIKYLKNYM